MLRKTPKVSQKIIPIMPIKMGIAQILWVSTLSILTLLACALDSPFFITDFSQTLSIKSVSHIGQCGFPVRAGLGLHLRYYMLKHILFVVGEAQRVHHRLVALDELLLRRIWEARLSCRHDPPQDEPPNVWLCEPLPSKSP